MYIHIGWKKMIFIDDIIAIVKASEDESADSPIRWLKSGKIIAIRPSEPAKTYIVTSENIFISPVSIQTIMKRVKAADSYLRKQSKI